ncbi:helix-turn-helix domain-containing protein [Streptomyces sp. NPDC055189]
MAAPTGPTVRRMQLGAELERLRKQAGFTNHKDVVDGLPISESQYYRVARGLSAFRKQSDLIAVLERFGVTDEDDVQFLVDIHRDSLNRGWWSIYARTMPSGMAMYVGLEDGARSLRCWQPNLVFGLLQTDEYARAVFQHAKTVEERTTEFVERGIELRKERRSVLTREKAPEVRAILDEAACHKVMGSSAIMRAQIEHLIELSELENITIQVLPMTTPTYRCSHNFTLLEFDHPLPSVVQMDTVDGGSEISDKDTAIWQFSRRFEALRDGAVPVGDTPKFLHQLSRKI